MNFSLELPTKKSLRDFRNQVRTLRGRSTSPHLWRNTTRNTQCFRIIRIPNQFSTYVYTLTSWVGGHNSKLHTGVVLLVDTDRILFQPRWIWKAFHCTLVWIYYFNFVFQKAHEHKLVMVLILNYRYWNLNAVDASAYTYRMHEIYRTHGFRNPHFFFFLLFCFFFSSFSPSFLYIGTLHEITHHNFHFFILPMEKPAVLLTVYKTLFGPRV